MHLYLCAHADSVALVNMTDPSKPTVYRNIVMPGGIGVINSGDAHKGVVAVVVDGSPSTNPGYVFIFDMRTGAQLANITLAGCSMPDMIYWTKDRSRFIIACEGEPSTQVSMAKASPRFS